MNTQKDRFLGLMSTPVGLFKEENAFLEELIEEFPYCSSLHVLHARALHNLHHIKSEQALRLAAAYSGNRAMLYDLLQEPIPLMEEENFTVDGKAGEIAHEESDIIEEKEENLEGEKEKKDEGEEQSEKEVETDRALSGFSMPVSSSLSFHEWLAKLKTNPQLPEKTGTPINTVIGDELDQLYREHIFHIEDSINADTVEFRLESSSDQLIRQFIEDKPQIRGTEQKNQDQENKARKSAEDDGEFVSETLALIYLSQKHLDKAIRVYEKLSLKMPEKKPYFASLIEKIKKDHQLS